MIKFLGDTALFAEIPLALKLYIIEVAPQIL